ncbi:hypothetical protein HUA74_23570 [Myxococcus sp. CA051A]|uniref:hypothetical protein n=1 Tax=unclassified Myxococcus TaxID=2648731 RepID=UPI00157B8693|nr:MULTISPECIES: hypothetical protein [unclassified Myxococcus]NTX17126.1 hypothetical protein [Myxococcus sp. CA056]NTX35913.1 hypothetical protein [Myxococcus sp. CA033]NTX63640.1 hypothetical protein [Myxococcus sp. CA051A]
MAAVILDARCVAPFVVRVRFSDGHEGEASLKPCLFDWEPARVPDLTEETRDWLRSPENFQTVRVDPETGTLAWGDVKPFSTSLVYWRVEQYRMKVTVRSKQGEVLSKLLLGGRHEVWSSPLTVGRAATNVIVVDQEGVAEHQVKVTVGGGHHPCFYIEAVEGVTTVGAKQLSTPGERCRVSAREPLLLEVGACVVDIE